MDKLNSEAIEQSALLAEKQAEADEALRLITTSMTVSFNSNLNYYHYYFVVKRGIAMLLVDFIC